MIRVSIDPGMTGALLRQIRQVDHWQPVKMPVLKVSKGKGYRSELDLHNLALTINHLIAGPLNQHANELPNHLTINPEFPNHLTADRPEIHNRLSHLTADQSKTAPRGSVGAAAVSRTPLVLLERQAPHRDQGFFGNASIMHSYGVLQGMLTAFGVPYRIVDPQRWRAAMGLGQGKERSWLLLARECPSLAAQVGSWSTAHRIAVADCWCMLSAEQGKPINDDWLA